MRLPPPDLSDSGHFPRVRQRIPSTILLLFLLPLHFTPTFGAPALPGPPIFEAISHYPSSCYLPPESGLCPPANRSTTPSDNNKVSGDDAPIVDNGDDSEDSRARIALLTRFYFDPVTAQCYPFGAQNCGGNENRFETQSDCLEKCRIES